jgi:hypothetical protein
MGQVADARQAHLQGSGYRRGREGQHIDVGAQLLDGFFVSDPEALFLVDHQKTQVLELHVA